MIMSGLYPNRTGYTALMVDRRRLKDLLDQYMAIPDEYAGALRGEELSGYSSPLVEAE